MCLYFRFPPCLLPTEPGRKSYEGRNYQQSKKQWKKTLILLACPFPVQAEIVEKSWISTLSKRYDQLFSCTLPLERSLCKEKQIEGTLTKSGFPNMIFLWFSPCPDTLIGERQADKSNIHKHQVSYKLKIFVRNTVDLPDNEKLSWS